MVAKIVLDTNVLLSGLQSKRGVSYKLLKKINHPKLELQISVPLILEYEKILVEKLSPKILSRKQIENLLDYLCSIGKANKIFYLWRPSLKDPKDEMVLELAVAAKANYIVTYNQKDFKGIESFGIKTIRPKLLLQSLGEKI